MASRLAIAVLLIAAIAATARADRKDRPRAVFGFELGALGLAGHDTTYGIGGGRGLVLGVRGTRVGVEWQLNQRFHLTQPDENLRGRGLDGRTNVSTVALRWALVPRYLSVMLGFTRLRAPMVTADAAGTLAGGEINGRGVLVGIGGGVERGPVGVLLEGRVGWALWELPPDPYLRMTATGAYERTTEPVSPVPWTITLGVRAFL